MAICPKCGCEKCVKDGIVKGRQLYQCKSCGYRHTVQQVGKSATIKRQAFELYLEQKEWGQVLKKNGVKKEKRMGSGLALQQMILGLKWPPESRQ